MNAGTEQPPAALGEVYTKIERAKEHIGELESEIQHFQKSAPYEVVPAREANTGDTVFVLRVHSSLPLRCNTIVGDVIHNLRSSLDYLARHLVLANGGKPTRHTAFPIFVGADEFRSKGPERVAGASAKALALISRVQPYGGGNDDLWRLHRLSIVDKHHLMIGLGAAHEEVVIDFGARMREVALKAGFDWAKDTPALEVGIRPANTQYPLVDGTVLYRIKAGNEVTEADMNPKFTLQVAFGEGEVVQGAPVLPVLQQLVSAVKQTVGIFHPLFVR